MNYDKLHRTLVLKYGSWEKPEETYTERHRILPGCLGGEYVEGNAFYVPARVHFLCHYLLVKIYPKNEGLNHALFRMSNSRKYGSKVYKWAKEQWVEHMKIANPSTQPSTKEKRAEHMRIRHISGDPTVDFRGDKSPLRDPKIKIKMLNTRSLNRKQANSEGKPYGIIPPEKHCMKKPEYQKAASENAKRQWQNPEIRSKMSIAIGKSQVRAICLECGMESTIGNITRHQKSKNHHGIERK